MRKLMLTTAIVALTSMGAVAQTAGTTTQAGAATNEARTVPAFLVSDFTGKNLYTVNIDEARTLRERAMSGDRGSWERDTMRWESSETFTASRDAWEDIGSIGDVVMTQNGEVRGILIDVGGFLGIGARSVMVDIDELFFVADEARAEAIDDFFVVAAMTKEELESLPEWDDSQLSLGFEARGYQSSDAERGMQAGEDRDQTAMQQPAAGAAQQPETGATDPARDTGMARTDVPEGYGVMSAEDRTADRLIGADVYGREGENIATVDDLVMGSDGSVTHAVIDVGGFLGVASHTVAIEIDDIDILWNDEDGDVRVQLPMTQEELESLPEYQGG